MSAARVFISVLIFLGIINLLAVGLLTSQAQATSFVFSDNQTLISGAGGGALASTVPSNLCQLNADNSFLGMLAGFINLIPMVNCMVGFFAFSFSYQGISSGYIWLSIIDGALVVPLIYYGLRLIRGGG
jgi:hypothetical protein